MSWEKTVVYVWVVALTPEMTTVALPTHKSTQATPSYAPILVMFFLLKKRQKRSLQ